MKIKINYVLLLIILVSFNTLYSQEKNEIKEPDEPYLFELIESKDKALEARIQKNNGSTKGVGLKSHNRWKGFWIPRVGKYGKLKDAIKYTQIAAKNGLYDCNSEANWSELGPIGFPQTGTNQRGIGRMNFVKLHPDYNGTTNQIVFAGGRAGLWKSTNNGDFWTNLNSDEFELPMCSDIAVMENSLGTEILLAGTGKRKANYDTSSQHSLGLKRSVNGGNTWSTVHLESTPWEVGSQRRITKISVDPNANNRVYVSVIKFSWGATNDFFNSTTMTDNFIGQLFVSENYGQTWTKVYEGFSIEDFEFKTNDSNTFYFSGHQLVKGVRSSSGNFSFTNLTPKLSGFNFNLAYNVGHGKRMEVEVTEDNSNAIFVFANGLDSNQPKKLWKSTNNGTTFSLVNETSFPSTMTWQRGALEVSNVDETIVYITGVNSGVSTNGGQSFQNFSQSDVHVDTNDVSASTVGQEVFLANDAGMYRSFDNGQNWDIISDGLGIGQVYDIGMSLRTNTSVPDIIEAGLLDVTCMTRLSNGNWIQPVGVSGDGMVCIVDPVDPNIVYNESQNGNIRRSTNGGQSFSNYGVGGASGVWVTPMVLDPNNHNRLLVGKDHVRTREGSTTSQLTIPFSVANSQRISALNVAKSDSNIIYVAYTQGIPIYDSATYGNAWWLDPNRKMKEQILKTTNGGSTWTDVSPLDLMTGSHGYISSIEIHPTDADKIWVTYSEFNSKHQVIKTTDGGTVWENYSQGLPAKIPVNKIIRTQTANSIYKCDFLYLATDVGVFYRNSNAAEWECFSDGIPNVPIMDLEIDPYQNIIRCASFGRGIWEAGLHPNDIPYNDSGFTFATSCATNGTTTVEVTPNDGAPSQWWALYEVSGANLTSDSATIGQVGSIQCCSAGTKTFANLDANKFYYVKHGVWDACHNWQETRIYIPKIPETTSVAFNFEDAQGNLKTEFCPNEDVYLDGTASQGETNYHLKSWRRPIAGGTFVNHSTYGWTTNAQVGVMNLSYEFLNNGSNPGATFDPGYEYKIRLGIQNLPCVNWKVKYKRFKVLSSCFTGPGPSVGLFRSTNTSVGLIKTTVSPNPNKGIMEVTFSNSLDDFSIEIFTIDGAQVFSKRYKKRQQVLIDLSKHSAGVYLMNVSSENYSTTKKVIIQ